MSDTKSHTYQEPNDNIDTSEVVDLASISLAQLCDINEQAIQAEQRKPILAAIHRVITQTRLQLGQDSIDKIVNLLGYLSDWPTLIAIQKEDLWHPERSDVALAEIHMGQFDVALNKVNRLSEQHPFDVGLETKKQELKQLIDNTPYPLSSLCDGAISLTPLNYYHVADFCWQYDYSNIAELCNLPQFPSAQHWVYWLYICLQEKERNLFAVIHREHGFIGSVCLQVFNQVGFFYYWLGSDFQGKGYGPKAVNILLNLGHKYLSMKCCYAKVFNYNKPSIKAVKRLGFNQLPFSAVAPSDKELFFYSGDKKTKNEHLIELSNLLGDMKSGIVLNK